MIATFAPGWRIVVRDEEWLVRRVDPSSDGGHLLSCDGVSELVRGRCSQFLTQLEDRIKILDPASAQLTQDTSSHFNSTLLYLEAQLRRSCPNDEKIHLGHRGVMTLAPYQLDPAHQALKQPRQRILIVLDDRVVISVPVATNRVTTICFTGPIAAIDAAGVSNDPKFPGAFQLAHSRAILPVSTSATAQDGFSKTSRHGW